MLLPHISSYFGKILVTLDLVRPNMLSFSKTSLCYRAILNNWTRTGIDLDKWKKTASVYLTGFDKPLSLSLKLNLGYYFQYSKQSF